MNSVSSNFLSTTWENGSPDHVEFRMDGAWPRVKKANLQQMSFIAGVFTTAVYFLAQGLGALVYSLQEKMACASSDPISVTSMQAALQF